MGRPLVGFKPISHPSARLLVLGSMPGKRSLNAGEYYAHPQNGFWRIMQHLIGLDPAWSYDRRVAAVIDARIAVWDVLHQCERPGSLDTSIIGESIKVNKFPTFFRQHPEIKLVCFNGGFAEQCYKKHVQTKLKNAAIECVRLPSTSPAHTLAFEKKLNAWKAAFRDDLYDVGIAKPHARDV